MITHSFFDIRSTFELLFGADESFATVDHLLHQFHFSETDSLVVGNVPLPAGAGRCVLAPAASGLHSIALGEILKLVRRKSLGQLGHENHGGAAQAGSHVAGTSVDLTEMVVELLA